MSTESANLSTEVVVNTTDVANTTDVVENTNVSVQQSSQSIRKNPYEVVFFAKYNNRDSKYIPSIETITDFFAKYGTIDHLDYNQEKHIAYIYMTRLSTTQTFLRTRSTLTQMIAEMTPATKFYVSVARANRPNRSRTSDRTNNYDATVRNNNYQNRVPRLNKENTQSEDNNLRRPSTLKQKHERQPRFTNNRTRDSFESDRVIHRTRPSNTDYTDYTNYRKFNNKNNRNTQVIDLTNRPPRFRLNRRSVQNRSSDSLPVERVEYTQHVSRVPLIDVISNKKNNRFGFNIKSVRGLNDSGPNRKPSPRNPTNANSSRPKKLLTYVPVRKVSAESN